MIKLDRLKSQLMTSGLQQKDQPLFQVISSLIDALRQLEGQLTGQITEIIDNSITNIPSNSGLGSVGMDGIDGQDGEDGLSITGPQGVQGIQGIQGIQGTPGGPPGIQGMPGIDGNDGVDIEYISIDSSGSGGSSPVVVYPVFPFVEPIDGDFSWINQGGASVVVTGAGIEFNAPLNAGASVRLRVKSSPSTPYTVVVAIKLGWIINTANTQLGGVGFRESGSGKFVSFLFGRTAAGLGFKVSKWDSPTVFSAHYYDVIELSSVNQFPPDLLWFKIADDGANRICSISYDGFTFIQIHSVGRTDFLTADQLCLIMSEQSNVTPIAMLVESWDES